MLSAPLSCTQSDVIARSNQPADSRLQSDWQSKSLEDAPPQDPMVNTAIQRAASGADAALHTCKSNTDLQAVPELASHRQLSFRALSSATPQALSCNTAQVSPASARNYHDQPDLLH